MPETTTSSPSSALSVVEVTAGTLARTYRAFALNWSEKLTSNAVIGLINGRVGQKCLLEIWVHLVEDPGKKVVVFWRDYNNELPCPIFPRKTRDLEPEK